MDGANIDEINRRFEFLCGLIEREFAALKETSEEEYTPQGRTTAEVTYKATPIEELKSLGPKRLTIEEYRQRQKKPVVENKPIQPKKTKRGGKKLKLRKQRKELHRLVTIAEGNYKNKLIHQLKQLKHGQAVQQRGDH